MKQEYFLPEEIIEDVKKSALDDNFSNKVIHSLRYEERTPLWHYAVYFFAFAFACILYYIFGGKLSFDSITNAIAGFFSFLIFLLKDIRFYIVFTLVFLTLIIILLNKNIYSYDH
jgi:hypothetical protein